MRYTQIIYIHDEYVYFYILMCAVGLILFILIREFIDMVKKIKKQFIFLFCQLFKFPKF